MVRPERVTVLGTGIRVKTSDVPDESHSSTQSRRSYGLLQDAEGETQYLMKQLFENTSGRWSLRCR